MGEAFSAIAHLVNAFPSFADSLRPGVHSAAIRIPSSARPGKECGSTLASHGCQLAAAAVASRGQTRRPDGGRHTMTATSRGAMKLIQPSCATRISTSFRSAYKKRRRAQRFRRAAATTARNSRRCSACALAWRRSPSGPEPSS